MVGLRWVRRSYMLLIQQVGEVKSHEKEDRGWLRVRYG